MLLEEIIDIVKSNPLPAWIYDITPQTFLYINDAAQNIFGKKRSHVENIMAGVVTELENSSSACGTEDRVNRNFRDEIKTLNVKGRKVALKILSHPLKIEKRTCLLITCQEISKEAVYKERVREQNKILDIIIKKIPGAFYIVNRDLKLLHWNQRLRDITGRKESKLKKNNVLSLFPDSEHEKIVEAIEKAFKNGDSRIASKVFTKEGRTTPVYLDASSIMFNGEPSIAGLSIDISGLVTARKKAYKHSKLLQAVANLAGVEISIKNGSGRIEFSNQKEFYDSHNPRNGRENDIQDTFGLFGKEWELENGIKNEAIVQEFGERSKWYEKREVNGEERTFLSENITLKNIPGSEKYDCTILTDVSEQQKFKETLKREKDFVETVIASLPGLFYVVNEKAQIINFNYNAIKELGYSPLELRNISLKELFPTELKRIYEAMQKVFREGKGSIKAKISTRDGTLVDYYFNANLFSDNNTLYLVGNAINISEHVEAERRLKASLHEKEILLAEIHHRVKNNLAMVSGMMELQAIESDNIDLKNRLRESQSRILSIASTHEVLYKENSFDKIDLSKNVEKITESILKAFDSKVKVEFEMESTSVNINQALPTSLIVNEVLTNAIKHAFEDEQKGIITIKLHEEDGYIHLIMKDNGRGIPADYDFEQSDSLGIRLIKTLQVQLNADLVINSEQDGTTFQLVFLKSDIFGASNALRKSYLQIA